MNTRCKNPSQLLSLYQSTSFLVAVGYLGFFAFHGASLSLLGPLTFMVVVGLSSVLSRKGLLDWGARTLCTALWFAPAWCVGTTGGIESPIVLWLLPHIFMSAALLGWRPACIAGASSTLVVVLMSAMQGFLGPLNEFPPGAGTDTLRVLCAVSAIGMITFYGVTFSRETSAARDVVEHSELEVLRIKEAHDQHSIVAVTDPEGRITAVNDLFCQASQYSREELVGQTHRLLNSGHHPKEFWREAWDTIKRGEVWRGEIRNKAKDGSYYWMASSFVPILDTDGQVLEYIAIRTNVTKQKQAEEVARQAQLDAEQASRVKADFLATMSHEIRTPINGVTGMARLLADTQLTQEQTQYLEALSSSSGSLVTLIDDILDYSKLEAGKLEIGQEPFDLRELVEGIDEAISVRAEQHGIQFAAILERGVPRKLVGDKGRLRQVLLNLADNGVKFTNEGHATLRVSSMPDPAPDLDGETNDGSQPQSRELVQFSIEDTGIGISEDVLGSLFLPFSQADSSSSRNFGGTGLGLSISKQLCHAMGGDLGAVSTPGVGSTFTFTLSLAHVVEEEAEPSPWEKRILLVSQPCNHQEALTEALNSLGADVQHAAHPEQALELCEEGNSSIDAVLLRPVTGEEQAGARAVALLASRLRASGIQLFIVLPISQLSRMEALVSEGATGVLSEPVRLARLQKELEPSRGSCAPDLHRQHDSLAGSLAGHVLLVDDNKINRIIGSRILKKFGLKVTMCENGLEAVQAVTTGDFELVLMDCQMPVMDGYEATRALRERGGAMSLENFPIIALTAGAMEGDRKACQEAGMNVHVAKPIVPEVLHAVLCRYLRQVA